MEQSSNVTRRPKNVAGGVESAEEPSENAPVRVEDEAEDTRDASAQRSEAAKHQMRSSGDDRERAGAFLSVTTYATNNTTLRWTHMRVLLLRDSTQLEGLGAALSAAGARVEPDSVRRRRQGEYSATLRVRVGAAVTQVVR